MNVNPCCHQCQLLQEGREGNQEQENESLSVFSFLWVTVDAEVEGRAEITLVFTRTSPVLCGLPTNNKRCCGERWFCWQRGEGGGKKPQTSPPCSSMRQGSWPSLAVIPGGRWWWLCAGLCTTLRTIVQELLVWGCWKGIDKLPDKLLFCCKSNLNKWNRRKQNTSSKILAPVSKRKRSFFLFSLHWPSCFVMKKSRTQLLPIFLPCFAPLGFVDAAGVLRLM